MSELPSSVSVLVIGAGVHGLSTAWHLARKGTDVLVVDKTGVAAGASGIACGVVRNNYFQPAMAELMAACVEIWESDPEALHYHGTGYIALGPGGAGVGPRRGPRAPPADRLRLGADHGRGRRRRAHARAVPRLARAGASPSACTSTAAASRSTRSRCSAWPTRRAPRAREIVEGVEVTGFERDGAGAVTAVRTSAGDVAVEQVVVAVGPWIAAAVGDARPAGPARRPPARRQRRARPADVDLLVPAGGRGGLRPGGRSRPPTARCRRCCTSTRTRRCTPTTAR